MKYLIIAVLAILSSACQNMGQYSAAYQAEHEKTFWAEYKGGGVDAAAWANLKAHNAAEKKVGR